MIGARVGSYEIVRELARGGMAVVYLAHQPALDRLVALKRLDLSSGQPTLAQRFVDEARVAARLDHPNIVTVHDFCEHEGVPYIAMEYVQGGSLRPHLDDLDLAQTLGVLDDVLAALTHAAGHGVTHRDLKPENVLVTPRGTVKITDFGIALAHDAVTRLTSTGTAIGTPVYMAPEQAGGGQIGPRTDLYAVGVMAYEMLAGRPPFPGDDAPLAVLYKHVHDHPPPLEQLAPDLPPELAGWVMQLLAKDPADRPRRAEDARKRLEEIAVARLGPYWRRAAALLPPGELEPEAETLKVTPAAVRSPIRDEDVPLTIASPPQADEPATTALPRPGRSRRRLLTLFAGAGVLAAGLAIASRIGGDEDGAPPAAARAVAFDFGGGRQTAVGLPQWAAPDAPRSSGMLVLLGPDSTPQVVAPGAAGGSIAPTRGDRFGVALASGDFDGDGFADLAVGAPSARAGAASGRPGAVTVIAGAAGGISARRRVVVGSDDHLPGVGGGFGAALAAADLDGDRFSDLVVGAPQTDPFPVEDGGSGSIRLLFGGRSGLSADRSRTIRRVQADDAGFGSLVAVADVDRDGHPDVLEASEGHSAYCAGAARGPTACRAIDSRGATALAVADMTGDRHPDVVHGVAGATDKGATSGVVRIFRGTRRGPSRDVVLVTQETPHVPGHSQPGDGFGTAVTSGDIDRDGYADLVVGAPGEDDGAGRLSLIRGGPRGYATTGNRAFEQDDPGMPGAKRASYAFGAALALTPAVSSGGLDLAVAAPGEGNRGTVWLLHAVTPGLGSEDIRRVSFARVPGRGRSDPAVSIAG